MLVLNAAIVTPTIPPSGEEVRLAISCATHVACTQGFEANPDHYLSRGTKLDPVLSIRRLGNDITNSICDTRGSAPDYPDLRRIGTCTDLISRTFIYLYIY